MMTSNAPQTKKERRVIAFSPYLGSSVGGAELSLLNQLRTLDEAGHTIEIISVEGYRQFNACQLGRTLPGHWKQSHLNTQTRLSRFKYLEYLLVRARVIAHFRMLPDDAELHTYGIWGVAAVLGYQGHSIFYVRSEYDLGISRNYHQGLKRWLWWGNYLFELAAFRQFRADLRQAMKQAQIISNSRFMADQVRNIFGTESTVTYPDVSVDALKAQLNDWRASSESSAEAGIVFVGDSVIKGLNTALDIARAMPDHQFHFFGRHTSEPHMTDNIHWHPWTQDPLETYAMAKVVIVPSLCQEAYGRVAREAFLLGIPTLVSQTGGLPEAVDGKDDYLVQEFTQPGAWVKRLRSLLSEQNRATT